MCPGKNLCLVRVSAEIIANSNSMELNRIGLSNPPPPLSSVLMDSVHYQELFYAFPSSEHK